MSGRTTSSMAPNSAREARLSGMRMVVHSAGDGRGAPIMHERAGCPSGRAESDVPRPAMIAGALHLRALSLPAALVAERLLGERASVARAVALEPGEPLAGEHGEDDQDDDQDEVIRDPGNHGEPFRATRAP